MCDKNRVQIFWIYVNSFDLWDIGNIKLNPVKSLNRLWLGKCNKFDVIIVKLESELR